jgi:hypothetical protein
MSSNSGYTKLQEAEEGIAAETPSPSQRPWSRFFSLFGRAVLFTFAVYGIISASGFAASAVLPTITGSFHPYIKWGWIHTPHRPSCRCGATLEEAIANGCSYDSHALSWLPLHCQDQELLAEWERSGPGLDGQWEYWADRNGTIPMTVEEVAALGGKPIGEGWFWMTQAWHVKVR